MAVRLAALDVLRTLLGLLGEVPPEALPDLKAPVMLQLICPNSCLRHQVSCYRLHALASLTQRPSNGLFAFQAWAMYASALKSARLAAWTLQPREQGWNGVNSLNLPCDVQASHALAALAQAEQASASGLLEACLENLSISAMQLSAPGGGQAGHVSAQSYCVSVCAQETELPGS